MATEESRLAGHQIIEDSLTCGDLATGDAGYAACEREAFEKQIFRLALALATEPSKLWQLRQMVAHLQVVSMSREDFSRWAIEQIDKKVMSMALEYAHDAEVMVQVLSFAGATFAGLTQSIEDFYRLGQISQRVYVRARLLLRTSEQAEH